MLRWALMRLLAALSVAGGIVLAGTLSVAR
jgi:hypothetical protein